MPVPLFPVCHLTPQPLIVISYSTFARTALNSGSGLMRETSVKTVERKHVTVKSCFNSGGGGGGDLFCACLTS